LHRVIAANVHAVPAPFLALAVRSEEPRHAGDARVNIEAPLGACCSPTIRRQAAASLIARGGTL